MSGERGHQPTSDWHKNGTTLVCYATIVEFLVLGTEASPNGRESPLIDSRLGAFEKLG